MNKAGTIKVSLVLALAVASVKVAAAQNLASARSAFLQQRFPDTERAYRAILINGSPVDQLDAALGLSDIEWRIRGDTLAALSALQPFMTRSAALSTASRARLDAGNVAGAVIAARAALSAAGSSSESHDAALALADAAIAPYGAACIDSTASQATSADRRILDEARAQLRAAVDREPGRLDIAERLIRAAAISGDWPALAQGWRSYYGAARRVSGGAVERGDTELRALETDTHHAAATHAFAALADSKMFESAALIAGCRTGGQALHDTAHVVPYVSYLREVRRVTTKYYREVARARQDTAAWRRDLAAAGQRLWRRMGSVHQRGAPYDADSLASLLDRRFGLVTNIDRTAGTLDMHAGHRITNEERTVAQYGHSATIHFVELDDMVSDGYQTWAWGGHPAHGGWATESVIFQVRPVYAEVPLRAWLHATDPSVIASEADTIRRDSSSDIVRARQSDAGFFPSVAERMQRDERARLLDSLRRSGLSAAALQAEFGRIYGTAVVESSIFAHEGRHAIDRAMGSSRLSAAELEYRAKLSEIAFAPRPRLALAGILNATTGDATPHGTANARLQQGIVAWMATHRSTLWPADVPLVLEIPTLTDDELRAAARSLDPLARTSSHEESPTRPERIRVQ